MRKIFNASAFPTTYHLTAFTDFRPIHFKEYALVQLTANNITFMGLGIDMQPRRVFNVFFLCARVWALAFTSRLRDESFLLIYTFLPAYKVSGLSMDIGGHLMGNKRTQHLDLRATNAFIRLGSLLKPAQLVVV